MTMEDSSICYFRHRLNGLLNIKNSLLIPIVQLGYIALPKRFTGDYEADGFWEGINNLGLT